MSLVVLELKRPGPLLGIDLRLKGLGLIGMTIPDNTRLPLAATLPK
jgi:hypothetical protein